jgi:hypothetical protein
MAKTLTPPDINAEDIAKLMELQKGFEQTAARLERTTAAHKSAKAEHEEAAEALSKFLYALHHGLPLFEGQGEMEEA